MKLGLEGNALGERAKLQLFLTQKTPLTPSPPTLGMLVPMSRGAPTYTYTFSVDGVPLPATDKVRPWRKGCGGKVAKSVGEALLLPKDMKHWAKWDDDSLILNMKREATIVMNFCSSLIFYFSP